MEGSGLARILYRQLIRWTRQPAVREARFVARLPRTSEREQLAEPALAAFWPASPPRNAAGARAAIASGFRQPLDPGCLVSGGEGAVSERMAAGFALLRFLNDYTAHVEKLREKHLESLERGDVALEVGQVVRHKKFGFRGVAYAWDKRPVYDVSSWDGVQGLPSGDKQPFYRVLPDIGDCVHFLGAPREPRYVAQENLELVSDPAELRVLNPMIRDFFARFDEAERRFVPTEEHDYLFPRAAAAAPLGDRPAEGEGREAMAGAGEKAAAAAELAGRLRALKGSLLALIELQTSSTEEASVGQLGALLVSLTKKSGAAAQAVSSDIGAINMSKPMELTDELGALMGAPADDTLGVTSADPWRVSESSLEIVDDLQRLSALLEELRFNRSYGLKRSESMQWRVGDVVRHTKFGYRCVIAGWDPRPRWDVSQWDGVVGLPSGAEQPFYFAVPHEDDIGGDDSDGESWRYVAEENLELGNAGDWCEVSEQEEQQEKQEHYSPSHEWKSRGQLLGALFESFDNESGRFVPIERVRYQYPLDCHEDWLGAQDAELAERRSLLQRTLRAGLSGLLESASATQVLWDGLRDAESAEVAARYEAVLTMALSSHADNEVNDAVLAAASLIKSNNSHERPWEANNERPNIPESDQPEAPREALLRARAMSDGVIESHPGWSEGWRRRAECEYLLGLEAARRGRETAVRRRHGLALSQVRYQVGQVIEHAKHGYRGVIIGWDHVCKADSEWQARNSIHELALTHTGVLGPKQPFYHVAADGGGSYYVAQMNIQLLQGGRAKPDARLSKELKSDGVNVDAEPAHPDVEAHFEGFDSAESRYSPRKKLARRYPDDYNHKDGGAGFVASAAVLEDLVGEWRAVYGGFGEEQMTVKLHGLDGAVELVASVSKESKRGQRGMRLGEVSWRTWDGMKRLQVACVKRDAKPGPAKEGDVQWEEGEIELMSKTLIRLSLPGKGWECKIDLVRPTAYEQQFEHDDDAGPDCGEGSALALTVGADGAPVHDSAEGDDCGEELAERHYERSLADVERVLELEPRQWRAITGAAAVRSAQGRHGDAVELYERALDVAPWLGVQTNLRRCRLLTEEGESQREEEQQREERSELKTDLA